MWRNAVKVGAIWAGLLGPTCGAADVLSTTSLSPDEMRATAYVALRNQESARALAVSEALLVRDPDDPVALRLGAQAALNIGQSDVAIRHGTRLFRLSETSRARYDAARIVALGHAQKDEFTRSQIWLRRAYQAAPSAVTARQTADDYVAVRQRNPLQVSLDFGIRPSSNVNNGSTEDTFTIDFGQFELTLPITNSQQALSGYSLSAAADLSYRLNETPNSYTFANFGIQTTQVRIDSESRERAPDFDESSLASWRLDGGLTHVWAVGADNQPASVSFNYAATYYDRALFASEAQIAVSRRWRLDDQMTLTAHAELGQTKYRESDAEANLWSVGLDWRRALVNGHVLGLNSDVGRSLSDTARYDTSWQSVGASYDLGLVAERFDIEFSGNYLWRTYETPSSNGDLREDEVARAAIEIGLPALELYGFTPVVSFDARQSKSTSAIHTSEAFGVDLSLRSSF